MPVYQCVVASGVVDASARRSVAEEFTRIHVEITGAPATFVNVVFVERAEQSMFTAGVPSDRSVVCGFVRAGRDREQRERLLAGLSTAWCRITGQDSRDLILGLIEVDPTSTMEAGLILPAPGEEAEWFERNRDHLASLVAPPSA